MSVSDKIRRLAAQGLSRADISRTLGKRYQHVRNVLEGDKVRGAASTRPIQPTMAATIRPPPPSPAAGVGVFRLVVERDGALRLPGAALAALEVRPGDILMGHLEHGGLNLISAVASARRARELAREVVTGHDSLADSLIADRRMEAAPRHRWLRG